MSTRKFLIFLTIFASALALKAEYLFWQVSSETVSGDNYLSSIGVTEDSSEYQAVFRYGTGDDLTSYSTYSDGGETQFDLGGSGKASGGYAVDLNQIGAAGTSYYIEILHYDSGSWSGVARSELVSYSDVSSMNPSVVLKGDVLNPVAMASLSVWTGGGYSVPEPSSALLVMIGAALLGLKRKSV